MVALEELLGSVEEAMRAPVVTLTEATIASEAARILERAGASGAPVTAKDGERVVGFITMKDLTVRAGMRTAVLSGPFHRFEHLLTGVEVAEVMSRDVVIAHTDWPLMRAVETMERRGVHRLPVLDSFGRLVGILTRDDVLRRLARVGARIAIAAGSRLEPD
ncbi:MAG TPA: CBS domain-containing protein [Actinomycetota bacterium]|jgi:CBS domain-containing protein|nr:CBS domain-containing protein [Actinomycetota bacterium]